MLIHFISDFLKDDTLVRELCSAPEAALAAYDLTPRQMNALLSMDKGEIALAVAEELEQVSRQSPLRSLLAYPGDGESDRDGAFDCSSESPAATA